MKNKLIKFLVIFGLIIIPLTALKATNDTNNETLFVAKDEVISGNLIAAGESIIVDGTISGDLIVAAQSLVVSGRVEGAAGRVRLRPRLRLGPPRRAGGGAQRRCFPRYDQAH